MGVLRGRVQDKAAVISEFKAKKWGGFDDKLRELEFTGGVARVATIKVDPMLREEFMEYYREKVAPVYQRPGFKGAYLFVDPDEHSIQSTTKWRDTRSLDAATRRTEYLEAMSGLRRFILASPKVRTWHVAEDLAAEPGCDVSVADDGLGGGDRVVKSGKQNFDRAGGGIDYSY